MKILFLSSEVAPFAKTGGLADVAGSLPRVLQRLGHDVRVVMPCYRTTRQRFVLKPLGLAVAAPVAGFTETAVVFGAEAGEVPVYLLDHPGYFDREGLYGAAGQGDYPDNAERFGFFCRASLELCKTLEFTPDVIHCNDWQTGLLPVLLRTTYGRDPFFVATGTLFTIHNLGYQGHFPVTSLAPLGLDPELNRIEALEFYGNLSLLKGGIVFSEVVNTVSDRYCREIQTVEYGHGFDGILRSRHNRLFGVLNGITPDDWNPARLPYPFSAQALAGKAQCKQALQRELGLAEAAAIPLIVMVSRLDRQKGFDLIEAAWDEILALPVQFALLGSGDPELGAWFAARAATHPGRFAFSTAFDEDLSRRYYAGGDLFLMPSRYEPCGLSQLIALRYGTLPVVHRTGGLADTIVDPGEDAASANGFSFDAYTPEALLIALDRALRTFAEREAWQGMMRYAMQQDFSWEVSAHRYLELYRLVKEVVSE